MFNVFARHAAPSAVLMFNSGPAHGESVGEYSGDPLYHASLSPDEYSALLDSIGFEVLAHAVEDWRTGGLPVPDLDVIKQAERAVPRAGAGISPRAGPTIPPAGVRVGSGGNQCGSFAADLLQVQQTVFSDLNEKLYLAAAEASVGGSLA